MSGFEVAGVVLGAIPLVIASLEHYQAGKGAVASFVKYGGLLENLILRLTIHQHLYHTDILFLLQAAGVVELNLRDEDTVTECFRLLRDPEVDEEIEDWLGPLSDPFKQLVGQYESSLKAIVGHIKHIQRLPDVSSTGTLYAMPDADDLRTRPRKMTLARSFKRTPQIKRSLSRKESRSQSSGEN